MRRRRRHCMTIGVVFPQELLTIVFPQESAVANNHHQLGKLTIVNVQLNDALSASETSSEEYWMSWCVKYFWSTWLQKSLIHNSTVESTVLSNWGWKFQLISSGEFHPAPAQNQRMKVLTSPDAFALFCWTIDFWPATFYLQGWTMNKTRQQ